MEVNRPDRSAHRRQGKNDTLDAEAAARVVLAGTATSVPEAGERHVGMIRSLPLVRRIAQKARSQAANQLRALLVIRAWKGKESHDANRSVSASHPRRAAHRSRRPAPRRQST